MTSAVETLWELLGAEYGGDLRVVTYYERTNFETKMRPDLRETYSTEEDRRIVEEAALNGLHAPHLEDLFDAGRYNGAIVVFDEARIVHYPVSETRGIIVSVQRPGPRPSVATVENCLDRIDLRSYRPTSSRTSSES